MKRILTLLLVLIGLNGIAQVVDGINYQAVALDEDGREIPGTDINGNVLAESMFDVRFTIRSATNDGTIEYQETHADVNTDNFGLFTVVIGHGSTTTLSPVAMLNDIDWGADKHFLEVEIDLEQDGNYKLMSNQQMMAVPYAFYALNVGDVEWGNISDVPADLLDGDNVDDADNDPTNELQNWSNLPGIPAGLADGVDDVDDADNDPTNEYQLIYISNDTIYLTNGGFAVIPQFTSVDWTNITNIPADILDGDNVNDADSDPTNELQTWSTLPGIPVDLADGIDNVDDADNDPTNEITTVTDNGDGTSTLTDALGGTVTVDNDGIDNVDDADNDPTNELQALSLSNDTLYLSNSNSVYLGNLSGGGSGGSAPVGTISYPGANHMFYTPTTCSDGDTVISGAATMGGIYNFCNFHLEWTGSLNINSEAFLLIKADTIRIDGQINGVGLWGNKGTGGGGGGGGGGIASNSPCVCTGGTGLASGVNNTFESIDLISGGNGGGTALANHDGSPGQNVDTTSCLVGIDLNLTMKGARGTNGCGGGCTAQRFGGNGGAGVILIANYFEMAFTSSINLSGNPGDVNGGGAGGGGNFIVKSNSYGSLNGTIDVSGGVSTGTAGSLGKGGRGGDGLVLFITP